MPVGNVFTIVYGTRGDVWEERGPYVGEDDWDLLPINENKGLNESGS
jgi:hypothetical protein